MAPSTYTELFFLDEATAFAAGHRPCAECRRSDASRFKSLWLEANGALLRGKSGTLSNMDIVLHSERIDKDGKEFWDVHINGGRIPTGLQAVEWAKKVEKLGAGEIVLTCMDADGTQDGYDIEITRAVSEAVNIPVVASGGAGTNEHLYDALTEGKADAVLAASIYHYGKYMINESKHYLAEKNVPVRFNHAF